MIVIFAIPLLVAAIYLAYPVWLRCAARQSFGNEPEKVRINEITAILLCRNGKPYIEDKIWFLLNELKAFENNELIIIDDGSTDGSASVIEGFRDRPNVRIYINATCRGIPYGMNLGVEKARYGYIIFSDQRQRLSQDIVRKISEPLRHSAVGAASACISCCDRKKRTSLMRKYENVIKLNESRTGDLMGVYGPFYAVKKEAFFRLPENIVLDDLYLSLRILSNKKVVLLKDCEIVDDDLNSLYDYRRARRYLTGFLQIITDKDLIRALSPRQRIMLLWHKYLRLIIPPYLLALYLYSGIRLSADPFAGALFLLMTVAGILSFTKGRARVRSGLLTAFRINILYLAAMVGLLWEKASGGRVSFWRTRRKEPGREPDTRDIHCYDNPKTECNDI